MSSYRGNIITLTSCAGIADPQTNQFVTFIF